MEYTTIIWTMVVLGSIGAVAMAFWLLRSR
jgi:hypothetical protein